MKHILAMLLALLGASGALAQIYVKVVPEKKTFLSGEAMYMRLTITNNSGVPVELKSREYSSWLDIHVEHSTAGTELPQSKFALFPPLKVPAGMSVSRKIMTCPVRATTMCRPLSKCPTRRTCLLPRNPCLPSGRERPCGPRP